MTPSASAFSMIGAPCVSSAQTKCTSCPCIRWNRTQMSAWMYSMMWPMWNGPLAYGSAVVTKSLRRAGGSGGVPPGAGDIEEDLVHCRGKSNSSKSTLRRISKVAVFR